MYSEQHDWAGRTDGTRESCSKARLKKARERIVKSSKVDSKNSFIRNERPMLAGKLGCQTKLEKNVGTYLLT